MTRKVVIVGASHGGHQAIIELLNRYDDIDITLFEAGDFISFMSCGMELYLENDVTSVHDVRNFRPASFPQANVHILDNHLVTKINQSRQTVSVKNLKSNQDTEVSYDKLILSSGVTPNALAVPGADLENVFLMRGYDWATKIKAKLADDNIKNVTIVGAGYIGIEAAEAAAKAGKQVTLLDVISRPLGTYLDAELTDILSNELATRGVKVHTNIEISEFCGRNGQVEWVKSKQDNFPSDLVIQATGVKANTNWLRGTVDLDERGWIKNDPYLRTNLSNVYALGDATLAYSVAADKKMPIALATVARREARYIVKHLFEKIPTTPFSGVVGSSALSVFSYNFAQSGLNSFTAHRAGINVNSSYYEDNLRPTFIPKDKGNTKAYTKLFFQPFDHRLVGGAVLSKHDITAQGNVLALAIQYRLTLEDLAEADFFFQPGFDRQWSLLNLAAQHALGESEFTKK